MNREESVTDKINASMARGYSTAQMMNGCRHFGSAAADIWLKTWELIKRRLPPEPCPLSGEDELLPGLRVSLLVWVNDMNMALMNAGYVHGSYRDKHLRFSEELSERLDPGAWRGSFDKMRASALQRVGRRDEAYALMQAVVDADIDSGWSWISWGDLYSFEVPRDLDLAEAIYRRGLERATLRDREKVAERVEMLDELRRVLSEEPD